MTAPPSPLVRMGSKPGLLPPLEREPTDTSSINSPDLRSPAHPAPRSTATRAPAPLSPAPTAPRLPAPLSPAPTAPRSPAPLSPVPAAPRPPAPLSSAATPRTDNPTTNMTAEVKPKFEEENMVVQNTAKDGMHTFGIGKAGIARAVVIFSQPPESEPLSVCFHFPNTFLSHAYVLHCLHDAIKDVPDVGFKSLSFVDRNVRHGCTGLENRWIVRCKNLHTKENLLERGLNLCNKRVRVRSLDDTQDEEYMEYTRYNMHRTKLYGHAHEAIKKGHQRSYGQQGAAGDGDVETAISSATLKSEP